MRWSATVGVCGRDATIDLLLDEAQLLDVVAAVQPPAGLGALRLDHAVAILPAAQGRALHPEHAGHGADSSSS